MLTDLTKIEYHNANITHKNYFFLSNMHSVPSNHTQCIATNDSITTNLNWA